ncbi:MAG: YHS domain-containing (seleno)protein [Phycisphaerales bacterium]|jgi:YHS domain-containing protein|nr:YHS domain-containing (seleno)protein [Phycisphaerales bacterium]
MTRRRVAHRAAAATFLAALVLPAFTGIALAQDDSRPVEKYHLADAGVAIAGYDPVSYFPEGGGTPAIGSGAHAVERGGVTYHFASAEHAELFEKDPARYEPVFGGWCARAMARDQRVEIDPKSYSIVAGRLFLFASNDARDEWFAQVDRDVPDAIKNWRAFSGEDENARLTGAFSRSTGTYNLESKRLALKGYDPVAYFPEGGSRPAKGDKKRTVAFRGVDYRFASAQNAERFRQNPTRYEPAYGGWCAWAMAENDLTDIDPKSYIVTDDGRLYVFYDGLFGDTRKQWLNSSTDRTPEADANWSKRTGETPRH